MLTWDPKLDFEPSRTTKKLWLFVRKAPRVISGVTLPGLFQIAHFSVDTALFMAVLGLEIWGLANLLRLSGVSWVYMALPVFVDLALAIFRHLPYGALCRMENQLVVAKAPVELAILRRRIRSRKVFMGFFSGLILLAGLFKAQIFWAATYGSFDSLIAGILLSYFLAAIIHIRCTGFFLFGIFTSISLWLDKRRYERGKSSGAAIDSTVTVGSRRHSHELEPSSDLTVVSAREQRISRVDGGSHFWFETWSLFRDEELEALASAQRTEEQSSFVAREGLRHQLHILDVGPNASVEPTAEVRETPPHHQGPIEVVKDQRKREVSAGPSSAAMDRLLAFVPRLKTTAAWALCFLGVLLTACVAKGGGSGETMIPLTIALSGPVAPEGEYFPQELVDLAQPVWADRCNRLFFLDVKFVRLDQEPTEIVHLSDLDPKKVTEAAQTDNSLGKFFKFQPPPQRKIAVAKELLAKHRLEPALTKALGHVPSEQQISSVQELAAKPGSILVIVDAEGSAQAQEEWQRKVGTHTSFVAVQSAKDAVGPLASRLCDWSSKSASAAPNIIVFYNVSGAGAREAEQPKQTPGPDVQNQPKEGSALDHVPGLSEGADTALGVLLARVTQAGPEDLLGLDQDFVEAEEKFALDYRFPYEHAKFAVLGRATHPEAFGLLFRAGERAVRTGKGNEIVNRMDRDGDENGTFHKLAHGHPEWKKLRAAIEAGDSDQLVGGSQPEHHH